MLDSRIFPYITGLLEGCGNSASSLNSGIRQNVDSSSRLKMTAPS